MSIERVREDLDRRASLLTQLYTFVSPQYGGRYVYAKYVLPEIVVLVFGDRGQRGSLTEENLNLFFSKLGEIFASTKYPPETLFKIYVEIPPDISLIVSFPAKVMYDYFKEKITRADFLKQCEIWINGEKAIIEGDIIKIKGGVFKMDFVF
jgi:hypothetical protein